MSVASLLRDFAAHDAEEHADLERIRQLVDSGRDPWTRASPLHLTSSALVVHPPSKRVLLRWHDRMQSWLQVGGHADPGESAPYTIALRAAREETGLGDLEAWPDVARPTLLQVAVVPVPAGKGEPAHEHADLRFLLRTHRPDGVVPESDAALLRWLSIEDALSAIAEDNLRVCLLRLSAIFNRA